MSTDSPSKDGSAAVCPNGKKFYACVASPFRGCCSKDPCPSGVCPDFLNFNRDPREPGEKPTDSTMSLSSSTPAPAPSTKSDGGKSQQTPTATLADDKSKPAEAETHAPPPPPPPPPTNTMTTMTDSGITITIPNNSVVTVTMHTTITSKRPPSAPASDSALPTGTDTTLASGIPTPSATGTGAPSPATTDLGNNPDSAAGGFPQAAIVGIAVGSVALIAIISIAIFVIRRRRVRDDGGSEAYSPAYNEDRGDERREDLREEKNYPPPVSTHTTGTQGSGDPFAPFGDQQNNPFRPQSGAFEMDGTGIAPIELDGIGTPPPPPAPRLDPVQEGPVAPVDPQANLNSVQTEGGKPAYINHWNQYRNLGQAQS